MDSVERCGKELESSGASRRVQAPIPSREEQIVSGENKGGGEMQGVQAAQFVVDRELVVRDFAN